MDLDICRDGHSFSHDIQLYPSCPKEHIKRVFLSGVLDGLTRGLPLEGEHSHTEEQLWEKVEFAGGQVDLGGLADEWVEFVRLAYSWFTWFGRKTRSPSSDSKCLGCTKGCKITK